MDLDTAAQKIRPALESYRSACGFHKISGGQADPDAVDVLTALSNTVLALVEEVNRLKS